MFKNRGCSSDAYPSSRAACEGTRLSLRATATSNFAIALPQPIDLAGAPSLELHRRLHRCQTCSSCFSLLWVVYEADVMARYLPPATV